MTDARRIGLLAPQPEESALPARPFAGALDEAGAGSGDTAHAMLVLDSRGIVRFCQNTELVCCKEGDLLDKSVRTLIPEIGLSEETPGYNVAYAQFCFAHGTRQRHWVRSLSGYNRQMDIALRPLTIDSSYCLLVFLLPAAHSAAMHREMLMFIRFAEQLDEIVLITDTTGVIEYVNPAFERTTGYRRDEAIGHGAGIVGSGYHGSQFFESMWTALRDGREFRAVFVNRAKNGDIYHEEKTIRPFRTADGQVTHFVSTGRDVSERIKTVEHLTYLANYDSLTGLPNRNLFHDRLQQAISRATRREGRFCLLYLDLDHFKEVNDRHGHAAGDHLLQMAATCLKQNVREEDTVARLGGDEFVVLLEEILSNNDAERILSKFAMSLQSAIRTTGYDVPVSASIGVCIFPKDGKEESTLMTHADRAMYRAKASGGNHYVYFDSDDFPSTHQAAVKPRQAPRLPGAL